jgi:hypothetical protein
VRDGYKPDFSDVPQAEYAAEVDKDEGAVKRGRLARIRRVLRRLFWEF